MCLVIYHHCVVVFTDYGLGDQSGRPEDPQTLLDCCYVLPPVCDWKRRSSAFILTWAVFYSNQPFTARTGSGEKNNNREDNNKREDEEGDIQRGKTSHLTSASGLQLCRSITNPRMLLLNTQNPPCVSSWQPAWQSTQKPHSTTCALFMDDLCRLLLSSITVSYPDSNLF